MKFFGDGCFVLNPFGGDRVRDAESPSVKHEAGHRKNLAGGFGVNRVAEKRVAEVVVVDSDLVGPSGVEGAKNERGAVGCGVQEVQVGNGRFARAGIANVHALPVRRVAGDVVENRLVGLFGRGLRDGKVKLGGGAVGELVHEAGEGRLGFGHNDAAGGVFVEPVDDAGAGFIFVDRELSGAMVE